MKELEILIMKIVSQLHAPTGLPLAIIGEVSGMKRIECTPPQNYYPALIGFV
jgi:hypothetical protein